MKKFAISTILAVGLMPAAAFAYTVQVNGDTVYNVTSVTGGTDSITYTGTPVGGGGGNTAPVIGQTSFTITEPSTAAATITATDPGDVITYSITGGTHASLFTIGASSGVLTFNSASTVGAYFVEVTAQDDDATPLSDVETITINVSASGGGGGVCGTTPPAGYNYGADINFALDLAARSVEVEQNKITSMAFTSTTNPAYLGQFSLVPQTAVQGSRRVWITTICPGDAGSDYNSVNAATTKCAVEGFNIALNWRQQGTKKCVLTPNTDYYLNVEGMNCPTSTCNLWMDNYTSDNP